MRQSDDQGSLYIGLMSGTSMDGVDAAVVRFGVHECEVLAAHCYAYSGELQGELYAAVARPAETGVDQLSDLDHKVGQCFADATIALLESVGIAASEIKAVGSHGQTVRHRPDATRPFTLQIGDPNIIASRTGITTVADFRRRDLAIGGQGAPLAPAFHQWLFGNQQAVVLNLGGIANVTILQSSPDETTGFDTGPGNTLMDAWIRQAGGGAFDAAGAWAKSGKVIDPLLQVLMADDYLAIAPPKSTGVEYFNLPWLNAKLAAAGIDAEPADVQATLCEFTATSICGAIRTHIADTKKLLVCGGGAHNDYLLERISVHANGLPVESTANSGLDPDWVEAAAFAWLARQTLNGQAGNLPSVTGARHPTVLGGVYLT